MFTGKLVFPREEYLMMKLKSAAVAAAALVASVGVAGAEKMEVTHWWTSGGEAAAVSVFADAVNASGHE